MRNTGHSLDHTAGALRRRMPTFLSIPVELRLQIYSYILPKPRRGEQYLHIYPTSVLFAFDFHPKYKVSIRNVLRTCRAVHAEFSEYLYQRTKFIIVDHIAQDGFWLKRYIHVVRHLEIKVTSYQVLPINSHLRSMFWTLAESQQRCAGVHGKTRLNSLTINLASISPSAGGPEKQRFMHTLAYVLEDRRCRIAQALCAIRGLRRFDISGLEGEDVEELLERLRDKVTGNIAATSQRDLSFAQRMSAGF
jgi:hypothetical protein